jgi:DNA-binding beta-propeller fold protein YncE
MSFQHANKSVVCLVVVSAIALCATVRADHVELVAGFAGEGKEPLAGALDGPFGVDADPAGNLVMVEISGHRVLKLDRQGKLAIIAGTGQKGFSGDGGTALSAQFNQMHNLAIAPNGDIYIADTHNSRVRKIDAKTGLITTAVGTGEHGDAGDGGAAAKAKCGHIYCVSLDPSGERLYVVDLDHRKIRVVTLGDGVIHPLAGNGKRGVPRDGELAKESPLVDPRAVAADKAGNIYILERSGHALRVVASDGRIRTVVGTGKKGQSGDNGPALQAELNGPKHLCIDRNGDVIIADTENHLIRKFLTKENRIVRLAGTGRAGGDGVGRPPLEVQLKQPHGVFVDRAGTLYIVDSGNNRLLKIVN